MRAALKPTGARVIMTRDSDKIVPLLKIAIPGEKIKPMHRYPFTLILPQRVPKQPVFHNIIITKILKR